MYLFPDCSWITRDSEIDRSFTIVWIADYEGFRGHCLIRSRKDLAGSRTETFCEAMSAGKGVPFWSLDQKARTGTTAGAGLVGSTLRDLRDSPNLSRTWFQSGTKESPSHNPSVTRAGVYKLLAVDFGVGQPRAELTVSLVCYGAALLLLPLLARGNLAAVNCPH